MNLHDVLAPLVSILERHRIAYAVIGGYAVAAWGELRATRDVELFCSARDLGVLKSALQSAARRFEHRVGDSEDPISDVVRIEAGSGDTVFEIDVLAGIRGAPAGLLQRCRTIQIGNLAVQVASPEDVIILKLLAGSARDIEDARGILRVQDRRIDFSLLEQICPDPLKDTLEKLLDSEGKAG